MGKTKKNHPSQTWDLMGGDEVQVPQEVMSPCRCGVPSGNCCVQGALKGPENFDTVKSHLNFSFIFQPRRDGSPLDKLRAQPGTRNGCCAFAG